MTIKVRRLGIQPYETVWNAMRRFTKDRGSQTADEIWILQHEPVLTLGTQADASNIFPGNTLPVVQSDRGGEVTYHAPGQIVAYPLLDLRRRHLLIRPLVGRIEEAMMDTLIGFGIPARLHDNAPGVYVPSEGGAGEFQGIAKIGALGLKVSRGCSYHGCSLNVSMDLSPFSRINPCGYPGLRTTDMAHAGFRGSYAEAEESLIQHLIKNIEND